MTPNALVDDNHKKPVSQTMGRRRIAADQTVVGKDAERVESLLQYVLLLAAWVVAFLLGKELQAGFAQWRARRRSEQK